MDKEHGTSKGKRIRPSLLLVVVVVILFVMLVAAIVIPGYVSMRRYHAIHQHVVDMFCDLSRGMGPAGQGISLSYAYRVKLLRGLHKLGEVYGEKQGEAIFRALTSRVIEREVESYARTSDTVKLVHAIERAIRDTLESRLYLQEPKRMLADAVNELQQLPYSQLLDHIGWDRRLTLRKVGKKGREYTLTALFYTSTCPENTLTVRVDIDYDGIPHVLQPWYEDYVVAREDSTHAQWTRTER